MVNLTAQIYSYSFQKYTSGAYILSLCQTMYNRFLIAKLSVIFLVLFTHFNTFCFQGSTYQ